MAVQIDIDRERIVAFCQRYHIRKLALFGSVLRHDFRTDSDVDVLVEFEPGYVPGLGFFTIEAELAEIFGSQVDLNTPNFLSPSIRDQALAKAEVLYSRE